MFAQNFKVYSVFIADSVPNEDNEPPSPPFYGFPDEDIPPSYEGKN